MSGSISCGANWVSVSLRAGRAQQREKSACTEDVRGALSHHPLRYLRAGATSSFYFLSISLPLFLACLFACLFSFLSSLPGTQYSDVHNIYKQLLPTYFPQLLSKWLIGIENK